MHMTCNAKKGKYNGKTRKRKYEDKHNQIKAMRRTTKNKKGKEIAIKEKERTNKGNGKTRKQQNKNKGKRQ